jgi:3',5'-cyclic AMP phosphodiesterase CpdA
MKLICHLSDPHFGRHDPDVAEALLAELARVRPALVAISGDLTQRAREPQFRAARAWLDRLGVPYLVVPGNHDIPLYDVLRRFLAPRVRYRAIITPDLAPLYADDELAVVGIDTTQSFTFKHGRLRPEQVAHAIARLAPYPDHWRVVVAHHPFDHATGADAAVPMFEAAGIDLVLTGHLHAPDLRDIAMRNADHTMVAVHASTCMSTRLRGQPNGYNQLAFDGEHVTITHRAWTGTAFIDSAAKSYRRSAGAERMVKEAEVMPAQPAATPDGDTRAPV